MKINIQNLAIGILLIAGLFGPWITKGYEPYGGFNPQTGKLELRYHKEISLSPLFGYKSRDGNVTETAWFISIGTSFSAAMLISSAALFSFRFKRDWFKLIPFAITSMGIVIFFLSLGMGQAVGVDTRFGWGLITTLLAVILMFVLPMIELLRSPSIRLMNFYVM